MEKNLFMHQFVKKMIDEEEYDKNPINTDVLIGLSKTFVTILLQIFLFVYFFCLFHQRCKIIISFNHKNLNFNFSFQEYSTAVEYYKLSLASGNLRDFATNLQTAKCFEKLGDLENEGFEAPKLEDLGIEVSAKDAINNAISIGKNGNILIDNFNIFHCIRLV